LVQKGCRHESRLWRSRMNLCIYASSVNCCLAFIWEKLSGDTHDRYIHFVYHWLEISLSFVPIIVQWIATLSLVSGVLLLISTYCSSFFSSVFIWCSSEFILIHEIFAIFNSNKTWFAQIWINVTPNPKSDICRHHSFGIWHESKLKLVLTYKTYKNLLSNSFCSSQK
jgi:hypothetical protein